MADFSKGLITIIAKNVIDPSAGPVKRTAAVVALPVVAIGTSAVAAVKAIKKKKNREK